MGDVSRTPARVLLVDDDDDLRLLARLALEPDPRFEVVAEAANGFDAIAVAADMAPDVVLLDLDMPWLDGAEAVPHLRAASSRAMIVVWTVSPENPRAAAAVDLGATVVLDKATISPQKLGDRLAALAGDPPVALVD